MIFTKRTYRIARKRAMNAFLEEFWTNGYTDHFSETYGLCSKIVDRARREKGLYRETNSLLW